MKLYNYWRSSSSWRVRIALSYKGIPYTYQAVHLLKGEQFNEPFQSASPMGMVPLLEWEEEGKVRRLAQSLAIITYLESKFPSAPLFPSDSLSRAVAWQIAESINSSIQPFMNRATLAYLKAHSDIEETAWTGHWLGQGMARLEKMVRPNAGLYCLGDQVSVADVCLVPQIYGTKRFGAWDPSSFPTLAKIGENCEKLDAFRQAHAEAQPDADAQLALK